MTREFNQTATKILDVAESYTQLHGFNAFSYKDIQNEVGVKTSSIHYYFPTKQDLALSMAERYIERFGAKLVEISQEHDKGIDQIQALVDVYVQVLNQGKFCMCGMLASDILALPDIVNKALQEFFTMVTKWLSEALKLGIEQGDIKSNINAKAASAHLLAVLEGGMLIARTQKQSDYLEHVSAEALSQLKC